MNAKRLSRDSAVPLWQQMEEDLEARVRGGEFGELFPSEIALMEEYQVSRHTVRQALRELRSGGVVTGARGRPSRVAEPAEISEPLGALYSLFATLAARGLHLSSQVRIHDLRADGVVAARLGLEESTPLLYLDRIRHADGEPFALDQIWMPAHLAEPLLDADFTVASFYGELAERAGIRLDSGEEQIYAVTPTDIQRRLLACSPQAGAFAIRRLGRVRGEPAEWRQTLVRGDRFPLSAEFAASGYRLVAAPADLP